MKDYLITILMKDTVLVNEQIWKGESMEDVEKKINIFLYEKQFKEKREDNGVVRKKEEIIGNSVKWMKIISQSGGISEVFYISVEEMGSRWALKNA